MKIRLTQIDGKLPNLALMKLSHYFKSQGYDVFFEHSVSKGLFEPEYDLVFGSTIFTSSKKKVDLFRTSFPNAIVGGTGTEDYSTTVESYLGIVNNYEKYDYSIYPHFDASIGFTQRGCRLKCKFCVVPKKEGNIIETNTINDIWRGKGHPKKIHLLDNDFFGQANWRERSQEIIDGGFQVCFNQGINVRLIHKEGAEMLAKMKYMDDGFKTKRIYTAWDNRRDEQIFMKGINLMLDAGIKPKHIMVYMLCGYWPNETFDDIYFRFQKMVDMGLLPYPMVYGENKMLKRFQQWVIRRYYQFIPWEQFLNEKERDYYFKKQKNSINLWA